MNIHKFNTKPKTIPPKTYFYTSQRKLSNYRRAIIKG